MKKILRLFIVLCLFSTFNVYASTNTNERSEDNLLVPSYIEVTDSNKDNILNTPAVDASEKIYDYADLFSDEEEEALYKAVSKYIKKTNFDLAIVTINENNKSSARVYADDFYDYNEFGIDNEQSGVLFLIDMDTREFYQANTGKAMDIYTDNGREYVFDNIEDYIKNKEYYNGIEKFIKFITSYYEIDSMKGHYKVNNNGNIEKDYGPIAIVFIISTVITFIVMTIMIKKNKMVFKAHSADDFLVKDTLKVNKTSDKFMGSHVSKVSIHSDSSSGGSSHSGSSGVSHSGGGRGF